MFDAKVLAKSFNEVTATLPDLSLHRSPWSLANLGIGTTAREINELACS